MLFIGGETADGPLAHKRLQSVVTVRHLNTGTGNLRPEGRIQPATSTEL